MKLRAHDLVTFQVKEDSTQKIRYGTDSSSFTCCSGKTIDDSVDSFAFLCHNGDEFVQAVKRQMVLRSRIIILCQMLTSFNSYV